MARQHHLMFVVAASIFTAAGLSLAQEPTDASPREDVDPRFQRLDSDEDRSLSRDELFMIAPARFDQLDQNEDGLVSAAEFEAMENASDPHSVFRRLDTDEDGRIHADELPEGLRARFERFDANDDGYVNIDEAKRMALDAREARNGPTGLMRRLMELDLDGDGRLHRDELPEAMEFLRRQFDEFDVNEDGYIDGAELRAMTEESRRLRFRRRY